MSSAHLPALDGVRGIAILLVVICHISERFKFSNAVLRDLQSVGFAGWTGVDLFFVLSGFLITGILWDSKGAPNYFRNFYGRRTVRIFPLYYATLLVLFLLAPLVPAELIGPLAHDLVRARPYWLWYATYSVDFLTAWKGFLFAGHFWTLAVEEHFYLVWPILVYWLNRRALIRVSLLVVAAAFALRFALIVAGVDPAAIYVLTPCRIDGLALGAFVALRLRDTEGLGWLLGKARFVLPIFGAIWGLLMYRLGRWDQYLVIPQTVGFLVTELFYAAVLVYALASRRVGAVMSWRPLRRLGKYSYAIYIFHPFPALLAARMFALGDPSRYSIVSVWVSRIAGGTQLPYWLLLVLDGTAYVALVVAASAGLAALSWNVLESPCLRSKRFFVDSRSQQAIPEVLPRDPVLSSPVLQQ